MIDTPGVHALLWNQFVPILPHLTINQIVNQDEDPYGCVLNECFILQQRGHPEWSNNP